MMSESLSLKEEEVAEQLRALGYFNFSPAKIQQITKDLAVYLEDEGFQTSNTDESFLSGSSTTNSRDSETQRLPLQDVRDDLYQQYSLKQDHPDSYGKENYVIGSSNGYNANTRSVQHDYIDEHSFDVSTADDSYSADGRPWSRRQQQSAKPRPVMKRKVVRKQNGRAQIFDESITESESDISYLNERLAELNLSLHGEHQSRNNNCDTGSETSTTTSTSQQRSKRRPKSAPSKRSDSSLSSNSDRYTSQPLKSFIRPSTAPVRWQHDRKTDPVTRHQMYEAHWKAVRAPGERSHKGLRWNIREQMLCKHDVVLPRHNPRVYVPNSYVVPTDKKRQALRWAVRNSLANREMPYSSFNF